MQKSLNILMVEDSENDALLTVLELRRSGYAVTFERVDTAAAMQAALRRGPWDVVISDFAMPRFSGPAALQLLTVSGLDLPFIIVSGAIGEDVAVEAMRSGAHDYLMKGKLARLAPAVERELREAEVRRERRRAEENLLKAHAELEQRVQERTRELALANEKLRGEVAERLRTEAELTLAKGQAETANQAKDQFLAVLSHELRTPLAAVLLTSSLLERRRDLPPDVHADVQAITRDIKLEARIIDDLLDLTRIARGKLQFDFRPTDLHVLIEQAADLCRRGAGAEIQFDLHAGQHFVRGDAGRLQQVLCNLLSNARKFTPPDGRIMVQTANARAGTITVDVIDTGVGIEAEHLPRIFTAFEQGDGDRGRQFGGLGLGLAISRAITDAHGGTISARSAGKGRGATFTLELVTVTPALTPEPGSAASDVTPPQRVLRILIVDDHESTLRAMAKLLYGAGHEVRTATNIERAMHVAEQERFDLLVSDLGLPDGSGFALMRTLHERYGIQGIAVSGYGMEDHLRQSKAAGFAEHLTKPVDSRALEAAVQRVARLNPAPGADGRTPNPP